MQHGCIKFIRILVITKPRFNNNTNVICVKVMTIIIIFFVFNVPYPSRQVFNVKSYVCMGSSHQPYRVQFLLKV